MSIRGCDGRPSSIKRVMARRKIWLVYPYGNVPVAGEVVMRLVKVQVLLHGMSDASRRIFYECNLQATIEGLLSAMNVVMGRAAAA